MSNLNFVINGASVSATKYIGQARQFPIVVDEPQSLGGEDSAANPVEYLLAAYAGCFNVVVNLVAKEQGIKINHLNININGEINPEKFLGISNKERAGFQSLQIHIELDTDASPEQERLLIAKAKERCPVNDNLANPTPVNYLISQALFNN